MCAFPSRVGSAPNHPDNHNFVISIPPPCPVTWRKCRIVCRLLHITTLFTWCLTATCDLHGNDKYGGLTDIYQSCEHGARPTRNLRPPGGDHSAAQRACPSLRTRSRTRRRPRMHHPGRLGGEEDRAAGGPGINDPKRARNADWDGGGTRIHGTSLLQGYTQWTSMEPSGGVMNRLRCGQRSDSDGRSDGGVY